PLRSAIRRLLVADYTNRSRRHKPLTVSAPPHPRASPPRFASRSYVRRAQLRSLPAQSDSPATSPVHPCGLDTRFAHRGDSVPGPPSGIGVPPLLGSKPAAQISRPSGQDG